MPGTPPESRSTLTQDYQRDWPKYFDAVKDQPPRDTLMRALAAFERADAESASHRTADGTFPQPLPGRKGSRRLALDIACGEGRDTREMLRRGWRVIAIDSHKDAITRTLAALSDEAKARCDVRQLEMEEIATDATLARAVELRDTDAATGNAGRGGLDLVNASFALPFCEPTRFAEIWTWIAVALRPGGRFAGQFFGERDQWRSIRPGSHVTRDQLERLLGAYEVEYLDEVEKDGSDAMGGVKHHHVFHVVARRRA
jgi:tellurite methyltransferase